MPILDAPLSMEVFQRIGWQEGVSGSANKKCQPLTEAAGTAGNAARVAQESYEQIKHSAENDERRLRERARREAAEWAAGVLADQNAVLMSLAATGSGEQVEAVEVALLDTEGKTLL